MARAGTVRAADGGSKITGRWSSAGPYVSTSGPGSFGIREQPGGKANVAFSWRVLAKRKDLSGKRFEPLPNIPGADPKRQTVPLAPNVPAPVLPAVGQ